ncbi:class I SAM-dependent methyltransferase, partial [Candidatus Thorarchaeota archaeon]
MGPENSSPFDRLAERYDTWFDNEGSLVFAIEVKAFRSILHQLPKPWLEVGVGSGRFAQALGIENGIDPSAELLQMAEKRGVQSHRGRGEDLPFVDESFGTVFLIVTICFLDSPADVLEEIHRVLHPKGKLVLGLVLRESAWGRFYAAQKEQ